MCIASRIILECLLKPDHSRQVRTSKICRTTLTIQAKHCTKNPIGIFDCFTARRCSRLCLGFLGMMACAFCFEIAGKLAFNYTTFKCLPPTLGKPLDTRKFFAFPFKLHAGRAGLFASNRISISGDFERSNKAIQKSARPQISASP